MELSVGVAGAAARPLAAAGVPGAPATAGAGGWPGLLLVAPGGPCGPVALVLVSLTCSLRSLAGSPL